MRKLALILAIVACGKFSLAQELPIKKETAFKEGEVLTYKLKYGFITAAEATIKVEASDMKFDGNSTYRLVVDARTSGTFDIFYKIRDHYDSYIHKTELTPYFYQEDVREANYRRQDKARFYQDGKKVVANRGTFTTPTTQTFDLVSAYYFARSLDISKLKINTPSSSITFWVTKFRLLKYSTSVRKPSNLNWVRSTVLNLVRQLSLDVFLEKIVSCTFGLPMMETEFQ